LRELKEKEGKLVTKRMDQATYVQGIFALAQKLEGSSLVRTPIIHTRPSLPVKCTGGEMHGRYTAYLTGMYRRPSL
jgi:hypothetical protein